MACDAETGRQVRNERRQTLDNGKLELESLQLHCDGGQQGWMPVSIIKNPHATGRLPAVIFLHGTGARHGRGHAPCKRRLVLTGPDAPLFL